MAGISVGSVSVDVVPNASRFADQLRASIVPQAGTLGEEIGRQIADRIAASIRNGIQNGLQGGQPGAQGAQAGNSYGDEFSRVVKTKIEAALRSLPEVQIGVATSEAEQKLRDLHAELETLRNARIGVDIGADEALVKIDEIKVKLDELAHKSPDIAVRVDAARAVAELAAVKAEVDKLDHQHADVKVDSSAASAGISGLVAGIAAIGPALIPIAAVAAAGLGAVGLVAVAGAAGVGVLALALHGVSAAVTAVNAEQASAATDAKAYATAQASAAAAVQGAQASLANAVSSADNSSISSAQAVKTARTSLANAITSADNSTISSAEAVQKAQTGLANAIESADNSAISSAQAVQNARTGLATALTTADNAAISSAQAVETARVGLANAIATADNAAISSAEAVGNAQQALDDTTRAAALSVTNALQAEDNAETTLAQALQTEQVAQDALTTARKTAQQQIEDLTLSVQDGALSQRAANLAVETSKINLDKVLANPKSSTLQREQAQLTYDQAVQHLKDLGVHQDRLQTKQAQAVQAGVDGAAVVITAQDRISTSVRAVGTAQDNVAKTTAAVAEAQRAGLEKIGNAQQRLADSQRAQDTQARTSAQSVTAAQQTLSNAIRAQGVQAESSARAVAAAQQSVTNALRAQEVQARTSAQSVATAQQGVTDAIRAQGVQAASSAQSIENAQQGITNALRAQEQQSVSSAASVAAAQLALENAQRAQKTAAEQVSSSAQAAEKALAALTPAGREFVTFITGTMQPALKRLQETAAAGLLPGLQSGLANLLPIMPTVNDAVGKIARTMGDLFREAGKALDTPFYRQFITFIGDEGSKTLGTFGQIIGNLATGFFGLLQAFTPFTDAIGGGLLSLSKKFADFGTNVDPNSPLQKFIAYVKEVGPTVIDTFKQIGTFIGHVVEALTTYDGGVLTAIDQTFKFLNKFTPTELAGVLAGAALLFAVLNPGFGSITLAATFSTVALTSLYENNKTFKDYVDQHLTPALEKFVHSALQGLTDGYNNAADAAGRNSGAIQDQGVTAGKTANYLTDTVLPALGQALGILIQTSLTGLGYFGNSVLQIGDLTVHAVDTTKYGYGQIKDAYGFLRDDLAHGNDQIGSAYEFLRGRFDTANGQFKTGWNGLVEGFNFLRDRTREGGDQIGGAYEFLRDRIGGSNGTIQGGWNQLKDGLNFLKGDFDSFVTSVGQIWDKLKELTAKPINFVINTILNDGLIKAFNAVSGLIGIPPVPNIPAIPGYAGGGALHGPGTGTSDEILMYGSNNEHVVTEREVQGAGGHAAVEAQRKVWAENYANGGPITMKQVIPQFADGGPVTWPAMLGIIQKQFPDALDNSDYRPGPKYHGTGQALDIGFAGNNRAKLLDADKWIASNYSNSTELIHLGGVNIKYGQDKGDGFAFYGADTMNAHDTHVHWANDRDPSLNSGNVFSGIANSIGGVAGSVVHALRELVGSGFDAALSPLSSLIGSFGQAPPVIKGYPRAFFDTERGKVRDFLTGKADTKDSAGSAGGNYSGPIPGGDAVGRWRGLVDSTLGELGLNVGLDDKVLRQIATESSGNPNATQGNIGDVNNASGDLARGLMQVIGTTFRAYAGPYTSLGQYDPHASIYAGLNYAQATYGPDLSFLGQGHGYDAGGWLKPGDVGMNFTGRPEAVLTPEESAGLKAGMNSGGGGKDVTINVHSQPGQSGLEIALEVKRQLLFEMR